MPADWTLTPGPRLFGGNPSLDVLARVTFTLSNKLEVDWRSEDYSWFLHWFGVSADFTLLRTFFSIKTPTVCAAYEDLCATAFVFRRSAVARVLFEVRDTMRKNDPMSCDGVDFLQIAVKCGSRADGMLDVAKREVKPSGSSYKRSHCRDDQCVPRLFYAAAARRDIALMRILAGALGDCHDETHFRGNDGIQRISIVMHQVYAWEPEEIKDGYTMADYIQLLIQGGLLTTRLSAKCCYDDRPKVAVRNPESFTIDELVMMCPPKKRKNLQYVLLRWSNEHRLFINQAGVFTAALGGSQSLLDYVQSCKRNNTFEIRTTMQECLLFAASLNDTQTASALIQLGADPEVGLLSTNQERYLKGDLRWNPMIIAAAACNLETLYLLGDTKRSLPFLKSAPVYEICHLENSQTRYWDAMGRELRRLENLRRHYLHSLEKNSDSAIANGMVEVESFGCDDLIQPILDHSNVRSLFFMVEKRRIETIAWIRTLAAGHDLGTRIDVEIIEAALHCDPETRPLQYANEAYHQCDMLLLNGLVDSNLDYHEGDMDLLQLSIRAQCRLKVVEYLLSKGLRVHSRAAAQSGHTMLHDALLGRSRDRSQIVHLLLREGADYTRVAEGLSILEASMHRYFWRAEGPFTDYLSIFTHLFEIGAPVPYRTQPQSKEDDSLICQLINSGAEDDLILRVVDAGANLNARGRGNWCRRDTPLVLAILNCGEKLARAFIRRGSDVHAPGDDDGGLTALQTACAGDSPEFIEYLIRVHGANVNEAASKNRGSTALQQAVRSGSMSLVEFLLDQGADVNGLSGEGGYLRLDMKHRALDLAASDGKIDMVEFLLKAGGRSRSGGLSGAIDLARRAGHFAVVSVLLNWEKNHSRRIMEEAEWEWQPPEAACSLARP